MCPWNVDSRSQCITKNFICPMAAGDHPLLLLQHKWVKEQKQTCVFCCKIVEKPSLSHQQCLSWQISAYMTPKLTWRRKLGLRYHQCFPLKLDSIKNKMKICWCVITTSWTPSPTPDLSQARFLVHPVLWMLACTEVTSSCLVLAIMSFPTP